MGDLIIIKDRLEKKLEALEKQYKKKLNAPNFDFSYYLGFKDCLVSEIIYIEEKIRSI